MIKSHAEKRQPAPPVIGWIVTLTVILFYMYEYFLRVEPSPMIDYLIANYQISLASIGTIDGAYYWTYIPMQVLVGTIVDHYGVRKPLFIAIISCLLGSVLFSLEAFPMIILGRMLIGFGSAFGFVAVLKTASIWLPRKDFPLAVGIATALGMLGAILSLTSLTFLIQSLGVKSTIQLSIVMGIVLLYGSYILVHDKVHHHRKTHAKKRMKMIRHTFFSVVGDPQIWLLGFIGLALFLPTQLFSGLWGIPYFVHAKKYSPEVAAQLSSFLFWGWIIGAPLMGYIAEYWVRDERLMLLFGSVSSTILLLLLIYGNITQFYVTALMILALGICNSVQILVFDMATNISCRSHAGTAVAVTNMFVMFGGPIQTLIGQLIESYGQTGAVFTEYGFQQAFVIMPFLCLLATLIIFFLKNPAKNV